MIKGEEIRCMQDIDHQVDLLEIQKSIEWEKVTRSFRKTKNSVIPDLISIPVSFWLRRRKKRRRARKEE